MILPPPVPVIVPFVVYAPQDNSPVTLNRPFEPTPPVGSYVNPAESTRAPEAPTTTNLFTVEKLVIVALVNLADPS